MEWGGQYKFRSCSDVRLVTSVEDSERCSGQGTWDGTSCQCNRCIISDKVSHYEMWAMCQQCVLSERVLC